MIGYYSVFNAMARNINEKHNYGFYNNWCCCHYTLKGKSNSMIKTVEIIRKKSIKFNGDCKISFTNFAENSFGDMVTLESPNGKSHMYITPKYSLFDGHGIAKEDKVFHVAISTGDDIIQLIADDVLDFVEKFNDRMDIYYDYIVDFL